MARDLTALGIIIGVIGQAVSCLGLVLQKLAHQKLTEKGGKKPKWWKNPRWLIAFLIFFAGNLMAVVALALAPQSIISALVVLVLVFNTIFAPIFLKNEHIQKIDFVGIAIIITGTVFVIVWGTRSQEDYSSKDLLHLFAETRFIIYGSIVVCLIIVLIIYIHTLEKLNDGENADFKKTDTRKGKFNAFVYAVLPAILSSFNSLFSKICGEIVLTTARGDNQFTEWSTYLFIALFIVVDATQVVYLQRALRSFNALLIIPLYQVSLTVFGVLAGGIYFNEFSSFQDRAVHYPVLFTLGICTSIAGVVVLSKRKQSEPDEVPPSVAAIEKGDEKESDSKSLTESDDEAKEAAETPVTLGTVFVMALFSGIKWYAKQGLAAFEEGEQAPSDSEPVDGIKTPPSDDLNGPPTS